MFYSLLCLLLCFSQHALASCNADNCLNALRNHAISASSFCTPFLALPQTATSFPAFASPCSASTSRLSSACSCLIPSTSISTSASTSPTVTGSLTSSPTSTNTQCGISTVTELGNFTVTITSASTVTVTATVTTTTTTTASILPTCTPAIVGGNFMDPSGTLADFTVTDNPYVYNVILAPDVQNGLAIPNGVSQFLFLNFESAVLESSNYTLQQPIGTICAPYTSVTLSATILTDYGGGSVLFCISSTTCSPPQQIGITSTFDPYSATFLVPADIPITATMNIMYQYNNNENEGNPFFAGVGSFSLLAS